MALVIDHRLLTDGQLIKEVQLYGTDVERRLAKMVMEWMAIADFREQELQEERNNWES